MEAGARKSAQKGSDHICSSLTLENALAQHRLLLRDAFVRHVGYEVVCPFTSCHALLALPTAVLLTACAASDSKHPALRPIDAAAMQGTVERLAKEMLVPGAVVILRTPNGEFTTTYGVTTYRGTVPTSFDQHVRVGSNTKTWTGTVILQLVQEGRLSLDDPVSKYRPDVPNGEQHHDRAAARDAQRAVQLHDDARAEPDARRRSPRRPGHRRSCWRSRSSTPPDFPPGTAFHYSNTNTVLLGLIAEQLEGGKPLAAIMRDRLFAPSGPEEHAVPRHRV